MVRLCVTDEVHIGPSPIAISTYQQIVGSQIVADPEKRTVAVHAAVITVVVV